MSATATAPPPAAAGTPAARPSLPPGPPYPEMLCGLGWALRPLPFLERCQARYGDMFTLNMPYEGTWVLLAHPDMVKQVFTADPRVVHAGEANGVLLPVVGSRSVLLLDEREHMTERKLMLPSFHGERMQRYGELMTDIAEREIAGWPRGEPLRLRPRMQAVTLEIILRAVFGVDEGARLTRLRDRLAAMLQMVNGPATMAAMMLLGPHRLSRAATFSRAMTAVDDLIYEEIRRRRAADDLAERDDILSLLVQARHEDGAPMTERELRDELVTLLVAGHETTATSLSWAVERLVRHPEMLARLRAEAGSGDDAYMDAVVKETLRLRPVLPIVLRKLKEPMEVGGRLLPAGAAVAPCIHLIHRRPDVYPEPRRFRPERFLEQPAGTYSWIPFGGGVRRCLGASFASFEMKAVLGALVRSVELAPADRASERVRRRSITLVPERGAEVLVGEAA